MLPSEVNRNLPRLGSGTQAAHRGPSSGLPHPSPPHPPANSQLHSPVMSSLSGLWILTNKGDVLIRRLFRDDVNHSAADACVV